MGKGEEECEGPVWSCAGAGVGVNLQDSGFGGAQDVGFRFGT